jgi:carboxypeptidase T
MLKKFLIALSVPLIVLSVMAITVTAAQRPIASAASSNNQPLVARIYYRDPAQLAALRSSLDVWAVYPDRGYVDALIYSDQYVTLLVQGYRIEIDQDRTARLKQLGQYLPGQTNGLPGYPCYRTVEETYATAQSIVAAHPTLAQWIDIGDSWEKITPGGDPGYDLMVLKLTNQATTGPKPKFFAMSSVHAREYAPAELNTRFAEYLISHYGIDPDVTWLLDYNEVHLLLQANPDGRKKAETGLSWRKNTNNNYCANTNTRGADLNRNYPFYWNSCAPSDGCSSSNQCAETYRGPSAASEPETQAVVNYVRSQYPDLRADDLNAAAPVTTSGVFMDLHSYSELALWPWGFTSAVAPNGIAMQTLGRKFAYFNNYTPQQSIGLYPTDGTTDDFAYGELGVPAYTIEMGTDFFQDCTTFDNTIVPGNVPALVYALKSSRRPYQNPAGPDTLSVSVTPTSTFAGATITLTAVANDTRFNNSNGTEPTQNIAAARYSIDLPSWAAGAVTYPLSASDGAFNNPIESLQATVNLSGLGSGRHILFVESQDANGNWGSPSAVFVWITLVPNSAIVGSIHTQDTGGPIGGADVRATLGTTLTFQTTSLANGVYQLDVIAGQYALSAAKYGYHTATVGNVTAAVGIAASQNITLTPAAVHTVSGVVSDRESGQPLSATIQIDGYPYAPIHSNAATGYYSITLAEDITYTFQVNAVGYLPFARSIGPLTADRVADFALDVDRNSCTAPGYSLAGVKQSFDATTVPAGWTVINSGWSFNDPGGRGNQTGGSGNFAIVDSDKAGNVALDTELRTPPMNLAALTAVTLTFKSDFHYYSGGTAEVADVDVSINGVNGPWSNVWRRSGADDRGPKTYTIDLTALAAGQANVMIRFHYYNARYEWWWQIDDVQLGSCVALPAYNVQLTPNAGAQSGMPGAVLTYTLQLTNTGTVSDTYHMALSQPQWPAQVTPLTLTLLQHTGAPLTVTVSIPVTASVGDTATVRITATGSGTSAFRDLVTTAAAQPTTYTVLLPLVRKD